MWHSILMAAVLPGVLAGCSLNGGSAVPGPSSGDGAPTYGVIEGRVLTTSCGGPPGTGGCDPTPYRGSLVFCATMGQIGICPSARVDATGHYRIALRRGRHALIPAPAKGNVVQVTPRWVVVVAGESKTLNIDGGNLMK